MTTINECSTYRPTVWQRLGFGYAYTPTQDDEDFPEPEWAPGVFLTETFVHLDLIDRIRVLVSGKLHVQTRSKTDCAVNRASTVSAAKVLPPTFVFTPPQ